VAVEVTVKVEEDELPVVVAAAAVAEELPVVAGIVQASAVSSEEQGVAPLYLICLKPSSCCLLNSCSSPR